MEAAESVFDGFISYSHAADGLLAPRLQAGLQRFAKPWWKRRALRIFRDESSLSANPHLWSSITEALDQSGWFVLLLSPDAAQSPWVNQEIEYWKGQKDPSRVLPVLTDGKFEWIDGDVSGTAVPEQLEGAFTEEPRWVDMRFARDETDLDLKDPRFADAVADIASALRGVPKDELASEEVKQHRRTIRTAWAAGALVLLLGIAAVFAAIRAAQNATEAEVNAQLAEARELAASAVGVVDEDPRLATWLALTAIDQTPKDEDQPVEVINALWEAVGADPLVATIDHGFGGNTFVDLSPDGEALAISSAEGATLEVRDVETLELMWSYSEETEDGFARPVFSPDGSMLVLDVMDSEAEDSWRQSGVDELPNRVLVFDAQTGEVIRTLDFPDCMNVWAPSWSPDGSRLVVSPGFPRGCVRQGVSDPIWLEVFDTANWESKGIISIEGDDFAVRGIFLSDALLGAFRSHNPLEVYDVSTLERVDVLDQVADPVTPDVSVGGDRIVAHSNETLLGYVYDLQTGSQLDILGELEAWPTIPYGASISADGGAVAYATDGRVLVWDVTIGEQTHQLNAGSGSLNAVFTDDGTRLYSAHRDGTVRVWDLSEGGQVFDQIRPFPPGSFVNGNSFWVGSEVGMLVRFEFVPEFVTFIEFFSASTGDLIASPLVTEHLAVLLPNDLVVGQPLDSDRYRLIDPYSGEGEPVGPHCPDLSCAAVLSATKDQFAIVRKTETGSLEWNFFNSETAEPTGTESHDRAPRMADSFGANWVVTGDSNGNFAFISRDNGETNLETGFRSGTPEYSNDGRISALRPNGREIVLVDTETWDTVTLDLGFGRMRGLTFSPDDSLLAVADEDEVLIVDVAGQEVIQAIPIALVSDIHWVDTTTLLVANRSGSLWGTISLDIDELIQRARHAIADRPLTDQECLTYRIEPCPTVEDLRSG